MTKILLTQIGANGDCLLTTIIAGQLKEQDFKGCHLTWLVGDKYAQILINNPYIDEIITVPLSKHKNFAYAREHLDEQIELLAQKGKIFDHIFKLDINSENNPYVFGTIRSSYIRIYENKYKMKFTVPYNPVVCLTIKEEQKIETFVKKHGLLDDGTYPILFECSPQSGQSTMTLEKALVLSRKLCSFYPFIKVIITSKDKIESPEKNIIDGSELSYRENAGLINYGKLLVGCSSGITWLNTSTLSREIPTVQTIVNDGTHCNGIISPSMELDYKQLGLSTASIIELTDANDDYLFRCICNVIDLGIAKAKTLYHERTLEEINRCEDTLKKSKKIDVVKLLGILPFMTISESLSGKTWKIAGIPLIKKKIKANKIKWQFLNITLLKIIRDA